MGQVFRSDGLAKLTVADYSRLNAIGISLVCDLRSREERKTDPTVSQNGSPVFVIAPVSENSKGSSDSGDLTKALESNQPVEDPKAAFERFYVRMVFDSASKFGAVLRAIESLDPPSVFHCAAGRDRSGIMTAMLLPVLSVPYETIISDFLLSTQYLNEEGSAFPLPATGLKAQRARDNAEWCAYSLAIAVVFKAIKERYGSFDSYRRQALHFTDGDVVLLKARLLE